MRLIKGKKEKGTEKRLAPFVRRGAPGALMGDKTTERPNDSGQPQRCPFTRNGDIIIVVRKDNRSLTQIRDLVFNEMVKGSCKAFERVKLVQATNNEFYHPATDIQGINCDLCPARGAHIEMERPVVWT